MPFVRTLRVLAAALLVAGTVALATGDAYARAGSGYSLGSRGSRTYSMPAPTPLAPSTSPMQRSLGPSQPGYGTSYGYGYGYPRGGFLSGLMGGFFGMGLAGLLFGNGFWGGYGGFGSIFGLLFQFFLLYWLIRLAFGAFGGGWRGYRAGPGAGFAAAPGYGPFGGYGMASGREPAPNLDQADFDQFQHLLVAVQDDWTRRDLDAMRGHATPEMVAYFAEQLAGHASAGTENHVADVHLLQGDVSERWTENGIQYATVAMRYSLRDWTIHRATGRLVDGDPNNLVQVTEVWTFMRVAGGAWLLSAIQQT